MVPQCALASVTYPHNDFRGRANQSTKGERSAKAQCVVRTWVWCGAIGACGRVADPVALPQPAGTGAAAQPATAGQTAAMPTKLKHRLRRRQHVACSHSGKTAQYHSRKQLPPSGPSRSGGYSVQSSAFAEIKPPLARPVFFCKKKIEQNQNALILHTFRLHGLRYGITLHGMATAYALPAIPPTALDLVSSMVPWVPRAGGPAAAEERGHLPPRKSGGGGGSGSRPNSRRRSAEGPQPGGHPRGAVRMATRKAPCPVVDLQPWGVTVAPRQPLTWPSPWAWRSVTYLTLRILATQTFSGAAGVDGAPKQRKRRRGAGRGCSIRSTAHTHPRHSIARERKQTKRPKKKEWQPEIGLHTHSRANKEKKRQPIALRTLGSTFQLYVSSKTRSTHFEVLSSWAGAPIHCGRD